MLYGKAAELVLYLLFKPDADVVKVYRLKNIFFCFKWGVKVIYFASIIRASQNELCISLHIRNMNVPKLVSPTKLVNIERVDSCCDKCFKC